MTVPSLHEIQNWMQAALWYRAGIEDSAAAAAGSLAGLAIDDVVTRSLQMSSAERLAIYSHAYFARLLDCLESEFPAVRHAAGEEAFAGFAWGYLRQYPSESYTLSQLGRRFPDYLQVVRPQRESDSTQPDFADFLISLARLERTYSEVFDAPGPENCPSLSPDVLQAITPEQFADARLEFYQTVRLLSLPFPCHEFCSAIRQGREPVPLAPLVTPLVILRRDYIVRRLAVSPEQYEILSSLKCGETVGTALARAAEVSGSPASLVHDVQLWFAEWTAVRLFRAVIPPNACVPCATSA